MSIRVDPRRLSLLKELAATEGLRPGQLVQRWVEERLDPPKRLLRLAVEAECRVAIDSDAHAPGQLAWLPNGCERAFLCGVEVASVINAQGADDVLRWARSHDEAA